ILGALLQITTLRPLIGRDPLTTILATFGISLVIQKYALWQWGPSVRQISEPVRGDFTLFHLQYPWYRIATAILAALIISGLWLFLKYGKYGIWIRATTQDRVMAQAMGIPVPLVYTGVFALGSAMAAASGVLFGPFAGVTQTMGSTSPCARSSWSSSAGWATSAARSWPRSSSACSSARRRSSCAPRHP